MSKNNRALSIVEILEKVNDGGALEDVRDLLRKCCRLVDERGGQGSVTTMSPVLKHDLYMKVCDEGDYEFLSASGAVIKTIEEDYVPGFFPGDYYGDYLIFEMDGGKITNWDVSADRWVEYWDSRSEG